MVHIPGILTYLLHGAESWFAASQIPRISRKQKVHYRTHKHPPPVPILGQPYPVYIPTSHLLEIILILSTHEKHHYIKHILPLQKTCNVIYLRITICLSYIILNTLQ